MADLTLILGGAKSGKTSLALKMAENYPAVRMYLATAQAHDDEMLKRIARHQAERGPDWRTLEEPLDPASAIRNLPSGSISVLLLDCLTLWMSNLLAGEHLAIYEILDRVDQLADTVRQAFMPIIMVSNEVGWGIVPENALARAFRDLAGQVHQKLAAEASAVYLTAAGLPIKLK
jgi:adenosylcobinamide kinase / adenosylcobinamide-phosphate guanylyltransferase